MDPDMMIEKVLTDTDLSTQGWLILPTQKIENIEKNLGFTLPRNGAQVEILDNDKSYWLSLLAYLLRCENPVENWLCLCCKEVLCSRFVNRHMLMHHQQTAHCLALSYSDLSVWCFCCEAYLDAQIILQLRPVHQATYILKFGEAPPLPQL
ncbi:uncharacterized protein LOC108832422 [Raphanus sativus]|uniref:Uncharacterized protein LOC108832422 n=1 Tax=Raphanus sativus TaxID=3726 RepID=A0A9W3BRN3_RAPSA|nr:uncharacterized protein LOC108832422 [Raphanus sativus]